MHGSDEQFREILARADRLREVQAAKKAVVNCILSCAVCLALLITTFCYIPRITPADIAAGSAQYGSLLLGAPYTGYVVVGVLALLLGVCVVLLVKQLRRLRK